MSDAYLAHFSWNPMMLRNKSLENYRKSRGSMGNWSLSTQFQNNYGLLVLTILVVSASS